MEQRQESTMAESSSQGYNSKTSPTSRRESDNIFKTSIQTTESKKTLPPANEPCSGQDLCDQLSQLVQKPKWDKETAERFINLIINPNRQYQLDTKQKRSLEDAILSCPTEYCSTVHLTIVTANFIAPKGLRTLDNIIPRIERFVREVLELQPQIENALLKAQGDRVLLEWLKEKLNSQDSKQDLVGKKVNSKTIVNKQPEPTSLREPAGSNSKTNSSDKKSTVLGKKETLAKRVDLVRNLITLLICQGEVLVISSRMNLILEAFADSNHLQQITKTLPNPETDIQYRVKAVSELFKLVNPTATEAARLLLYGASAQILASQQVDEIAQLNGSLQKERELRHQKEHHIEQLKAHCNQLKQELINAQRNLEQSHIELDNEKKLYEQLKNSSTVKISQQRNAALSQVTNRIKHELQKLERCFNGNSDSFLVNSQIGIKIINKIREQLSTEEQD